MQASRKADINNLAKLWAIATKLHFGERARIPATSTMSPGTSSVAGSIEKHPAIAYMLIWNVVNLIKLGDNQKLEQRPEHKRKEHRNIFKYLNLNVILDNLDNRE